MKNQILEEENIQEEVTASGSTGFSPGQASLYYQTRSGWTYEQWIKGAYVVGTESQYILSWQSGSGPSNDLAHLNPLKRGWARFGAHNKTKQRTWLILAAQHLSLMALFRQSDVMANFSILTERLEPI